MVTIGTSPFSRQAMLDALEEFTKLYAQRPIKDNAGGMKSPHMFLTWYAAKTLNPTTIIESGVWKGQGTWLLRQACPLAKIYCIDPYAAAMEWADVNATYYTRDFSTQPWNGVDKEKTLLFFDDHQDAMERVKQARKLGFKHLLFEDNYPVGQGDCRSLKQVFEDREMIYNHGLDYLHSVLDVYEELPPVFTHRYTRWHTEWDEIQTPAPLLTKIEHPYQQLFFDEAVSYTWMCYAKLK